MRVAYLFDRFLPATQTDSEQALQTVAALARRGVEMVLVLPRPRDGEGPTLAQLQDYYQVEGDFHVETVTVPIGGWSTARKWAHALSATRSPLIDGCDLVYTRNFPTLFAVAPSDRPFAYETYRPWMDQYPPLKPAFRAAMNRPGFLGGVFHSGVARDRYAKLGVAQERLHVVHNGFDPSKFTDRLTKPQARQALNLPKDRPIVVYTGHINPTKGMNTVLGMARRCPQVLFLLVGAEGRGVVQLAAKAVANVQLVPWQPFDATVRYLFAADVLLQPPSAIGLKLIGNTVLPMKLFLYLAAGRPILAPDLPDVRELLTHDVDSVLVPSGDTGVAANALSAVLANPSRAERLSQAALERSTDLTWDARAARIEKILAEGLERVA